VRIPFNLSVRSIINVASTSLNIPVPTGTDPPEMVNRVSTKSHINTSHAQPNTLRARMATLGRATIMTRMFAHSIPLAPSPAVLQSLKAILLAS
jgi:hypothetical protein